MAEKEEIREGFPWHVVEDHHYARYCYKGKLQFRVWKSYGSFTTDMILHVLAALNAYSGKPCPTCQGKGWEETPDEVYPCLECGQSGLCVPGR